MMLYAYNASACVTKARSSKASSVLGQYGERRKEMSLGEIIPTGYVSRSCNLKG